MSNTSLRLGCSAFCLSDDSDIWIGRNLDVPFTNGYILSNPRGISKRSIVGDARSPAHWTSRCGSLTVNLLGVDCPMGGINERGLVIEHLWMPGTMYPDRQDCEYLLEFEWIQFMLDTCACVDDVLAKLEQVAILPGRVEMHFLLADGGGDCALLEFRCGQSVVYRGHAFQPAIVTNSWYDESVRHISSFVGYGGDRIPTLSATESLGRFSRLACTMRDCTMRDCTMRDTSPTDMGDFPEAAVRLLDSVADSTLLSAVFHPATGRMFFKTSENNNLRLLRTAEFDLSPASPRMMLDIHAETAAINTFDAKTIVSSMARVLSVGSEFLRLDAYHSLMLARQICEI
jgi:penicillin V acylase-like amidase (Ntn superfamily)